MANKFEGEIALSAKTLGLFYHKLAVPYGSWNRKTIFLHYNPFDSFILNEGKFIAMEMKSSSSHSSFPISNVKVHQVKGLQEVEDNGGWGYLVINQRYKRKLKAWFIGVANWKAVVDSIDRHSVKYSLMDSDSRFVPLERININTNGKSVRIWDLRRIVDGNQL